MDGAGGAFFFFMRALLLLMRAQLRPYPGIENLGDSLNPPRRFRWLERRVVIEVPKKDLYVAYP